MSSVLLIDLIIICGQVLQWEFCKTPFWLSAQTVIGQVPFLSLQNKDLEGKLLLWATGTYLLACFHKLPIHLFLWSLNPCAQHLELKRLHSPNGRCIFPNICIVMFLPFICSETLTLIAYNPQGSVVNVNDDLWPQSAEEFTLCSMTKYSMLSVEFRCLSWDFAAYFKKILMLWPTLLWSSSKCPALRG